MIGDAGSSFGQLGSDKVYRRAEVRRLFQALRDKALTEIRPKFTPDQGLAYPEAETIMEIPAVEVGRVLEFLADQNILSRALNQTILACPDCNSFTLSTRLRCGNCDSLSLSRGQILEHLMCGYSDFEASFEKLSELECPKCNKRLKALGIDYRRLGTLTKCSSCGERTANPKKMMVCGKAGHTFPEEAASLVDAYSYLVNPEMRGVIDRESVDFNSVSERMKAFGWDGRENARRIGESGTVHVFTFLTTPYGERIPEDPTKGVDSVSVAIEAVVGEKPLGEEHVLPLFAKGFDTKIAKLVLVAVPGLTEGAKRIAKYYSIHVLECQSPNLVSESLFELVRSIAEAEERRQVLEFMRSIAQERDGKTWSQNGVTQTRSPERSYTRGGSTR